jgi:hypothetical protein
MRSSQEQPKAPTALLQRPPFLLTPPSNLALPKTPITKASKFKKAAVAKTERGGAASRHLKAEGLLWKYGRRSLQHIGH